MDKMIKNGNRNFKRVSIIVPAYKADEYLKECLDSLSNQTYPAVEVVVVYEEHDLATRSILKEYKNKEKFKLISEEKNLGAAHTRNLAIKHSTGEYIAFCDADDTFRPEKIEEQMKLIDDEFGLIYSDFSLIDTEGSLVDDIETQEWNFDKWIRSYFICFSTVLVKKNFLEAGENLDFNEDFDLLIRLSQQTNFKRAPKLLAYRRIHSSNMSKNRKTVTVRYHIYRKYNYNFLAVRSLLNSLIYSRIFFFIVEKPFLYNTAKKILGK